MDPGAQCDSAADDPETGDGSAPGETDATEGAGASAEAEAAGGDAASAGAAGGGAAGRGTAEAV